MHSLKAENLSTRARVHRGHFEASEQDRVHAKVEVKWKPGGDGQDQKSPISVFLARTALSAVWAASRCETCALAFQHTNTHLAQQTEEASAV